jgi:hypothetical protein
MTILDATNIQLNKGTSIYQQKKKALAEFESEISQIQDPQCFLYTIFKNL